MQITLSKELLSRQDLSLPEKVIYAYIEQTPGSITLSNAEFAEMMAVSIRTVSRAIETLSSKEMILVVNGNSKWRRIYLPF